MVTNYDEGIEISSDFFFPEKQAFGFRHLVASWRVRAEQLL
jgi:hypothetical protein